MNAFCTTLYVKIFVRLPVCLSLYSVIVNLLLTRVTFVSLHSKFLSILVLIMVKVICLIRLISTGEQRHNHNRMQMPILQNESTICAVISEPQALFINHIYQFVNISSPNEMKDTINNTKRQKPTPTCLVYQMMQCHI